MHDLTVEPVEGGVRYAGAAYEWLVCGLAPVSFSVNVRWWWLIDHYCLRAMSLNCIQLTEERLFTITV